MAYSFLWLIDPIHENSLYLNATNFLENHSFFPSTVSLSNILLIKMDSFKNYLPLFCIASLLVAVKGEVQIGIQITPVLPRDYKYHISVRCWNNDKHVGSCETRGATCWIKPYKPKSKYENGEYTVRRKRIECSDNRYSIYVQRINAGGTSSRVKTNNQPRTIEDNTSAEFDYDNDLV